jgi:hypothetical protein
MRTRGIATTAIADELGLSIASVNKNLKAAAIMVDATTMLEHEQMIDMDRLEVLIKTFWPFVIGDPAHGIDPSLDHAQFVLKVIERRAKLLGLDAPKRIDVRAIVASWAVRQGLDVEDVVAVTYDLLPQPGAS